MDSLGNILSTSNPVAIIYYALMALGAVFVAGWAFNGRIKSVCKENISGFEVDVKVMQDKITKLEADKVNTETHNKDLLNIFQMVSSIRDDFKDGFKGVNARIDALLLATNSDSR